MASSAPTVDVLIVGAGVAGLQAAQVLLKRGLTCLVVEAQNYVGGRVVADTTLIPGASVALGAELVHGSTNLLKDTLVAAGVELAEVFTWSQGDGGPSEKEAPDGGAGYYFDGATQRLHRFDALPPAMSHMHDALAELGAAAARPLGTSLRSYLSSCGVRDPEMDMACAGYANTAGGTVDTVDARLSQLQDVLWADDGDVDYMVPGGMEQLVHILQKGVPLLLRWPVAVVDAASSRPGVRLTRVGGHEAVSASAVIVTVSPSVLKRGGITFSPPLPPPRLSALHRVVFPNAVKIHLVFSKRVWPEDCHGAVFSRSVVPEMWFRDVKTTGGTVVYLATGFLMGPRADAVVAKPSATSTALTVSQIFRAFKVPGTYEALVSARRHNWASHPYVHGGYSSAAVGEEAGDRRLLAGPHAGRVFFAGEALAGAHGESPMTLQGTLQTGIRAAEEAAAVLQRTKVNSRL